MKRYCLGILFALLASSASAKNAVLPYFNLDGYVTSLRLVNPTTTPVTMQSPYNTGGFGTFPITIGAYETRIFPSWPYAGGGTFVYYDVPNSLDVSVEVKDDQGSILRFQPLVGHAKTVQMQDLVVGDDIRAYLWVAAEGGADVTIQFYHDASPVGAALQRSVRASTDILPAPAGANRVTITPVIIGASDYLQAPFYAFIYHRRQSGRYELLTPIYPTEIP